MRQPPAEPPPQLQAALEYAARGIAILPSHFPAAWPPDGDAYSGAPACSCGSAQCSAPARHPFGDAAAGDASTDAVRLAGCWVGAPDANVATPAGSSFDLVELCHPAPAEAVLDWLAERGLHPGPMIAAGRTRHQFLVAAGVKGWRLTMIELGSVQRLGRGGGLVLLPPSRLVDGAACRWLRPLGAAPLPDGDALFAALSALPSRELAGLAPADLAPVGMGPDRPLPRAGWWPRPSPTT